jgi:hypothetical protein
MLLNDPSSPARLLSFHSLSLSLPPPLLAIPLPPTPTPPPNPYHLTPPHPASRIARSVSLALFLCLGIRNLILNQLHVRNLVSPRVIWLLGWRSKHRGYETLTRAHRHTQTRGISSTGSVFSFSLGVCRERDYVLVPFWGGSSKLLQRFILLPTADVQTCTIMIPRLQL